MGRKGRSAAEGRPGWGPDVLPVGEECRGEDGRKERGMEKGGGITAVAMSVVAIMSVRLHTLINHSTKCTRCKSRRRFHRPLPLRLSRCKAYPAGGEI